MPAKKSLRLKLVFPEKILGEPVIHTLSRTYKVAPNIMQGRITEKDAWLDLELSGTPKSLDSALKYLSGRDVTVRKLDK